MKGTLEEFEADRLQALLSLDERTIRRYCAKWQAWVSDNPEVFWRSVHKARVLCPGMPEAEREVSRRWLIDRGSRVPGSSLEVGQG